ncbi:glycosyltransferase [Halomonas sp. ATCH28]|uniref:Glycosyltransferase n=1 Tax=Halomonas gemina TaxID=2945105 RepID=A0ABT0T1V8_9GAMM|nr:glycosyltransferase [Halomonas gemina]MCL7940900.1 glycosyltransferase [Halomonas gemina]
MLRHGKVIISCTSTHDRMEYLYYSLQSILRQTFKPDVIHVNLSKTPYLRDSGVDSKPDWLESELIEVNFVENLGSYRKLIPTYGMAGHDDLIITIDDDVIYHKEWLSMMVGAADQHPDAIVCARARIIKKNIFGKWVNYNNWKRVRNATTSFWLLPIGCSGVVYRKHLLFEEFFYNRKFLDIASVNDDLWFRIASMLNNVPVYVNPSFDTENIKFPHNKGLANNNLFSYKGKILPLKIYNKLLSLILGNLGFSLTGNDKAWKDINCFISEYDTSIFHHDDKKNSSITHEESNIKNKAENNM